MRNRLYGGVRGRKMKVGEKLLHFPPTRLYICLQVSTLSYVLIFHNSILLHFIHTDILYLPI